MQLPSRLDTRLPTATETVLTLSDIVQKTSDLPTSPNVALAAIKHSDDPEATPKSMARILSQDQSLTVRVLRLSNSAFYGGSREVSNVSDAVAMLGMRTIRNLALLASTYPWLTRPLLGYGMGPNEMWAHSLSVAVGSQVVAELTGAANPETAFTAGILHDLGKTALNVWLEHKIDAMAQLAEVQQISFDEIERKVLGYDHQDVGAYMAKAWNLPSPLVSAMKSHHRPLESKEDCEIVCCVHIADYLSRAMGLGLGGDSVSYDFKEEVLVILRINHSDIDKFADELLDRFEKQDRLFTAIAA